MSTTTTPPSAEQSWLTLAAIAIVACVLADLTHEVLGHMLIGWLTGVKVLSLSTVAIQTASSSREVAAAGSTADVLAGALSLILFSRAKRLTTGALFFWLFGAFALLNVGYLVYSAASDSGDWAVVIQENSPAWLWRSGLGLTGAVLYALFVRWIMQSMIRMIQSEQIAVSELRTLVWVAYLAGGAVMTIAAFFNPISPSLILISGVGASFGLNWGILLVPTGARAVKGKSLVAAKMPVSLLWICLAVVVGGLFIAVFGPGIHFLN